MSEENSIIQTLSNLESAASIIKKINQNFTAIDNDKVSNEYIDPSDTSKGYKVLSDANYTAAEKTKLASIAQGAQVNVQSDWNADSGDAFIKNKPSLTFVKYDSNDQGLTAQQKANARTNIGAGTSNLELGNTTGTAFDGGLGKTAYDHSQAAHARSDATKVETSSTNGNIKINGQEATVYTLPSTVLHSSDISAWAKASSKPSYTASEVGADAEGTAASAVTTHNGDSSAHSDIRALVSTAQGKADDAYNLASGKSRGVSYTNYQSMVTAFNAESSASCKLGDSVYIETVAVPDLWVSQVLSSKASYTYSTDAALVSALKSNGYVNIGWYKLCQLETSKVPIEDYVNKDTQVNGHSFADGNISLNASDVGALADSTKYAKSLIVKSGAGNEHVLQLKDQDGTVLSEVTTADTTYTAVTADSTGAAAAGLMSSADKYKLDHISAQANKVTVPTTPDGTILIDGVAKQVMPDVDQVKYIDFPASNTTGFSWATANDISTLTITATNANKRPIGVYKLVNGFYEEVFVTPMYDGSSTIKLEADEPFAGRVLVI